MTDRNRRNIAAVGEGAKARLCQLLFSFSMQDSETKQCCKRHTLTSKRNYVDYFLFVLSSQESQSLLLSIHHVVPQGLIIITKIKSGMPEVRGLYECIQAIFIFRETNKQTKGVNRDFKSTENICRFSDVYMVQCTICS